MIAAACLGMSSVGHAEDTVNLRYRFEAGASVYYTVSDQSQFKIDFGQATETVQHGSQSLKHFTVRSVNADGSATIELMIDRAKMSKTQDGETVTYDSAKDEKPPEAFVGVHQTIGRALIQLEVTASGRVTKAKSLADNEGPAGNAAAPSDESMIQIFPVLPESGTVAVGAEWDEDYGASVLLEKSMLKKTVKMRRHYQLESVQEGKARISVKTVVLTSRLEPSEEAQLVAKIRQGTILFDVNAGLVASRELKVKNTAVGFQGPQSAINLESVSQETLVPEEKLGAIRAASAEKKLTK